MSQTIIGSAFNIARDRETDYRQMLDDLTLSGLIPLLNDEGDCVRVESIADYEQYSKNIQPVLQKYAEKIANNSKIFWIDGNKKWKTVVKADTVFTIITAFEPSTIKE